MRSPLTGILVLAVAASTAFTTASAHEGEHTGDEWPLLAHSTQDQGWASFEIESGAGKTAFQIHSGGFTSPITHGFALYTGDDKFIQAVAFSAFYARTGFRVHSTAPPEEPLDISLTVDEYSNATGGGGFTPVVTLTEPATFKAVTWVAAKHVADWSFDVRSENGQLRDQLAGTGSFLYQSDDFTGVAQVHPEVVGAGARASVALTKTIDVQDRLFAWYLQPFVSGCCQATTLASPNANLLSITTPSGERDCTLGCDIFRETQETGPGTYVFNLTGAGASPLSSADDISVIGTDARLP